MYDTGTEVIKMYLISGCGADLALSHLQEVHRGKRGTAKDAKERQERQVYRE